LKEGSSRKHRDHNVEEIDPQMTQMDTDEEQGIMQDRFD
jgi:hypothetical protein